MFSLKHLIDGTRVSVAEYWQQKHVLADSSLWLTAANSEIKGRR